MEQIVTKPFGEAWSRLAKAKKIPCPCRDHVVVRESDVNLLLADVLVSAGMEVDLAAAQAVIARLVDLSNTADENDFIPARKIRALLFTFYGEVPED